MCFTTGPDSPKRTLHAPNKPMASEATEAYLRDSRFRCPCVWRAV